MSHPNNSYPASEESDALDILGLLRRRKGFIILGAVLGLIAAGLYQFLSTPEYRAEMEILVGQKSADLINGASSNSSVEGVDADEDVLSTHIQLMTSRRIIKAAIEKHDLTRVPSVIEAKEEGVPTIEYITEQLHVTKGGAGVAKDAHTLRATYGDPSPTDCARILRAIFDEYQAYLDEHFQSTSTQAIELLTDLASDTNNDVREAEVALADHLSNTKVLWDGQKTRNIHKTRLEKIEADLLELTEIEAEQSSRLAVISDFVENADPETVTDFDRLALLSEKEVSRLKILFDVTRGDTVSEAFQAQQPIRQETARAEYDEYLALVMREKKLLENFSDDHPSVISVREQIAMMRTFIDENAAKLRKGEVNERMKPAEMLETYVNLLENDLAGIKRQREVLIKRSEHELAAAKKLEKDEMEAESLKLELARRQELYQSMNDTLSELNFVRDYAGFSTDIIGDADPQENPAWPEAKVVFPLGLIAGLVLGLVLGLIADLCDTTFTDPDDVERALGAPLLAHVHRFPNLVRKRSDPPLEVDKTVYVYHRPQSPEAEVFRVIRTSLMMSCKKTGHSIFHITSPLPGDGKSTTSVNLAAALAQTGKKTLLIDGDLRKPRVAKLLKLDQGDGLSEVLMELAEPSDVVRQTAVTNLWAVSCGSIPRNPAELLESDRFSELLELWREDFDFVIVDSPPALTVSDAAIISEKCDATVLALQITKNGRKVATRVVSLLRHHGAEIAGLVVNGHQNARKNFGYMESYDAQSYGYGYGKYGRSYYRDADKPPEPKTDQPSKQEPIAAE